MFTAINVAIGIVFIYLLFSLVVSAANEIILSAVAMRSRYLQEGIAELLQIHAQQSDPAVADAIKEFWNHPLIGSLSKGTKGRPSYIPSNLYVTVIIDLITTGKFGGKQEGDNFIGMVARIQNPDLKRALSALLADGDNDFARFKVELEHWFDTAMDRVSGWYKRFAQYCLLGIAVALAFLCNIDSIHIVQVLSSDHTVRDALVNQATEYIKAHPSLPQDQEDGLNLPAGLQKVEEDAEQLSDASIPLGWDDRQQAYFQDHWLNALCGCLLTALAASLGGAFWFDTLNRIMNIRAAGKVPDPASGTRKKKL
jgi:hypothetical protein